MVVIKIESVFVHFLLTFFSYKLHVSGLVFNVLFAGIYCTVHASEVFRRYQHVFHHQYCLQNDLYCVGLGVELCSLTYH